MKSGQRFIAGAVCPNCQAMDVLLLNASDQSIECVDCSYVQTEEQRDLEHQQSHAVNNKLKKMDDNNLIKITNIKS